MSRADGQHIAELLLGDLLWKVGIAAAVLILALLAATVIWRRIR